MNILITGSEGFVGKHLQSYLKEHNLTLIDRKINKEVLDITEQQIIDNDIIIHLAAQTSVWNKDDMLIENDNIKSFIYIFNLCKKHNKRFIYASSSCSINITSMYGLSKHFDDKYAELYGWDLCVGLRFHNVYGKNARENTLLGVCMLNDEITLYNKGLNYRHFTYIDDICYGIVKSFNLPKGLYNIVNPIETSVIDFVKEVQKYKDIKLNCVKDIRELDKERQKIDLSHKNIIEDNPTSIEIGIRNTFA